MAIEENDALGSITQLKQEIADLMKGGRSTSNKTINIAQNMSKGSGFVGKFLSGIAETRALTSSINEDEIMNKVRSYNAQIEAEKAKIQQVKAREEKFKNDLIKRQSEVKTSLKNSIGLFNIGDKERSLQTMSNAINASAMPNLGMKVIVTDFDPNDYTIKGYTQQVDESGNLVGEPIPLENATLQNTLPSIDLTEVFDESYLARQKGAAEGLKEMTKAKTVLGRDITQKEKEIRAGIKEKNIAETPMAQQKLNEYQGTVIDEVFKDALSFNRTRPALIGLASNIDNANTGALAEGGVIVASALEQLGLDIAPEKVASTSAIQQYSNKLTVPLVKALGSNPSNADLKVIQSTVSNIGKTKLANKQYLGMAVTAGYITNKKAKIVEEAAKQGLSSSEIINMLRGVELEASSKLRKVKDLIEYYEKRKVPFEKTLEIIQKEILGERVL